MCSRFVTVLLLASATNGSGGQSGVGEGGGGVGECTNWSVYISPTGAQMPITSYTCTQPNIAGFLDQGQCTASRGLWMCAIKEGVHPALLSSSISLGVYGWRGNTNPFVVLEFP